MINMSYCRRENTAAAMQECVNDIESGETNEMSQFEALSDTEQAGLLSMVRSAADLLEMLPVGVLAKAGVRLDRLPSQDFIRTEGGRQMDTAA